MARLYRRLPPRTVEKLFEQGRQNEILLEEAHRQSGRRMARLGGWTRMYHTQRSKRSDHGWPDEVFGRWEPEPRIIYVEWKRDGEHLTPDQYEWLSLLLAHGQEVYIWWMPSMEDQAMRVLLHGEKIPHSYP